MSYRITRVILEKKLNILASYLGKQTGYGKGKWDLDHYSFGGGYAIVEYDNDAGAISHPLINGRFSAKIMVEILDSAMAMARLMQKKEANQ
jgi:hypothetical protein